MYKYTLQEHIELSTLFETFDTLEPEIIKKLYLNKVYSNFTLAGPCYVSYTGLYHDKRVFKILKDYESYLYEESKYVFIHYEDLLINRGFVIRL